LDPEMGCAQEREREGTRMGRGGLVVVVFVLSSRRPRDGTFRVCAGEGGVESGEVRGQGQAEEGCPVVSFVVVVVHRRRVSISRVCSY